jgi:hypothetical protein
VGQRRETGSRRAVWFLENGISYGWDKGKFFVNSAAYLSPDELENRGWPVDVGGSVSAQQLWKTLGVSSGTNVVLGRYGIRDYVQSTWQPRGKPLSKRAANEFVAGTILPNAEKTNGVDWMTGRSSSPSSRIAMRTSRRRGSPPGSSADGRRKETNDHFRRNPRLVPLRSVHRRP